METTTVGDFAEALALGVCCFASGLSLGALAWRSAKVGMLAVSGFMTSGSIFVVAMILHFVSAASAPPVPSEAEGLSRTLLAIGGTFAGAALGTLLSVSGKSEG